jgi:hypothetical protein
MPITSLFISHVNLRFTAQEIACKFAEEEIAIIKSITLIPQLVDDYIFNWGYIDIHEWCDSEAAYNCIQQLTRLEKSQLKVSDDDTWSITINTHNDGNLELCTYTRVTKVTTTVPLAL